eukprot:Rhum_TRINITY_DN14321_c17_g1::Rhum_TRINITY_DN14321_c17_g1_i1::g.81496::m.81496
MLCSIRRKKPQKRKKKVFLSGLGEIMPPPPLPLPSTFPSPHFPSVSRESRLTCFSLIILLFRAGMRALDKKSDVTFCCISLSPLSTHSPFFPFFSPASLSRFSVRSRRVFWQPHVDPQLVTLPAGVFVGSRCVQLSHERRKKKKKGGRMQESIQLFVFHTHTHTHSHLSSTQTALFPKIVLFFSSSFFLFFPSFFFPIYFFFRFLFFWLLPPFFSPSRSQKPILCSFYFPFSFFQPRKSPLPPPRHPEYLPFPTPSFILCCYPPPQSTINSLWETRNDEGEGKRCSVPHTSELEPSTTDPQLPDRETGSWNGFMKR